MVEQYENVTSIKYCPACHTRQRDRYKFCPFCGVPLKIKDERNFIFDAMKELVEDCDRDVFYLLMFRIFGKYVTPPEFLIMLKKYLEI
jgi:hypothetical protein